MTNGAHITIAENGFAVCDRAPVSTPGVLSYSFASLGAWMRTLATGNPFSDCDSSVFHGRYDAGSNPSVALFPMAGSLPVGVVAVHSSPVPSGTPMPCGQPMPRPAGVVLDRWALWAVPGTPAPTPPSVWVRQ